MKHWLCVVVLSLAFGACTDAEQARTILTEDGYTNIQITGFEPLGCGKGDDFSTGFHATTMAGHRVRGVVCCGVLKGCTVRRLP